jgi:hypothetical protein
VTHAITTPSAEDCGCGWPHPATPVVLHRRLRPGLNPDTLSVFDDDRWDLSPGIFEGHAGGVSVNFAACPPALRPAVKHYLWEAINLLPSGLCLGAGNSFSSGCCHVRNVVRGPCDVKRHPPSVRRARA